MGTMGDERRRARRRGMGRERVRRIMEVVALFGVVMVLLGVVVVCFRMGGRGSAVGMGTNVEMGIGMKD